MTSNYMCDVQVEIAFGAGYNTPAASRVWTDVSQWVELADSVADTFGRQDERATADANDLTLTLDNTDGRFTAGRAASPYYPNVKIGRPIRVTATPPGGSASVRFVGFIDEWPVEWAAGTDAYAKASIRATTRLARLGLSTSLRSGLENEILQDRPGAYWTLGDPAGSTAATESSGQARGQLIPTGSGTAVVFGDATGPSTDGLTAATFVAGGQYLSAELAGLPSRALRLCLQLTALPSTKVFVARLYESGSSASLVTIELTSAGQIQVTRGSALLLGPTLAANSAPRDILVAFPDASTVSLYVDGTLAASAASGGTMGNARLLQVGATSSGETLAGVLSHVALYNIAPSSARASAQAGAVLGLEIGERTDERAARILGWAGVAASEVTTQTGSETMTYQQTSGQSVVDALRDVESTEGGVLFDGRDGNVTFHNRSNRYQAPIAVTFDMAAQQVEADYAPKMDRSTLTNDVTVDNPTTGETARSVDTASVDEYGTATSSAKSVAETYDALQQKAAWLVASYAEPRSRVPSLTVDVLAQVGGSPSAGDILALTIGSRIRVTNQPAQADATTADYFVEGYSETIGPESYRITFNLSPAHPSLSTFVLDDPERGQLDSGFVLGL
jgi:hypothetical protein